MSYTPYNYVIIKESYPELERESTLLNSKFLKSKKYAMLFKQSYKDGSESITHIKYSNNLNGLQSVAEGFSSWYNYPLGKFQDIKGNIKQLQ